MGPRVICTNHGIRAAGGSPDNSHDWIKPENNRTKSLSIPITAGKQQSARKTISGVDRPGVYRALTIVFFGARAMTREVHANGDGEVFEI